MSDDQIATEPAAAPDKNGEKAKTRKKSGGRPKMPRDRRRQMASFRMPLYLLLHLKAYSIDHDKAVTLIIEELIREWLESKGLIRKKLPDVEGLPVKEELVPKEVAA